MISYIQPLQKSQNAINFIWMPEPVSDVASYNIYVGLAPGLMTELVTGILNVTDHVRIGKISYVVSAANVQSVLSITTDFSNTDLYFAITYVNTSGIESNINDSTIVEVPPVGITPRYMEDSANTNRHIYVFSNALQKWIKALGSDSGALTIEANDFTKSNITTMYTYNGTNIATILSYPTGAISGSPAKLTTYSYSGSLVKSIVVSDSTVS